jgi:hypothetical protein
MRLNSYDEVLKDDVSEDVQARFVDEIRRFRALGFTEEFYLRETVFPFSALLLFPILLYMHFRGERVRVGGMLQAMSFNPFLIHEEGHMYATALKLGVKFTSLFDDGTLLITSSFKNGIKSNPEYHMIQQTSKTASLVGAWKDHMWRISTLIDEGHRVIVPLGMKDVMRMEQRSDALSLNMVPEDLREKIKNAI